jgi:hypothetical protein
MFRYLYFISISSVFAVLFATSFLLSPTAKAQTSILFETPVHNIGNVTKSEKPITHNFVFRNISNRALTIQSVVPDCACSTVSFPQTPVQPDESATISVTYSPYRAGGFEKSFVVTSDGYPRVQTLTLKGFISPNTNPANIFVHQNGKLMFRYKNLNFGTITNRATVARKFEMYNPTNEDIYFSDRVMKPSHINVYFDSSHIIPAKKTGAIVLTYNPEMKNTAGFFQEEITMFTADKDSVRMLIAIEIQGEQDAGAPVPTYISPTTTLRKPTLKMSENWQNLGNVYPDMVVITEFVIYNEGSMDLRIDKLVPDDFCEVQDLASWQNAVIPAGQFRIIKVRFKQGTIVGKQTGAVSVYSNDIATPSQKIEFHTNVVDY